jgi:hypothetical protein
MSKNKTDFKLRSETSTLDINPRRIFILVTDLIQLNVVSKEENFLEDKSKESQLPELLSENQRSFSLMRLLLL